MAFIIGYQGVFIGEISTLFMVDQSPVEPLKSIHLAYNFKVVDNSLPSVLKYFILESIYLGRNWGIIAPSVPMVGNDSLVGAIDEFARHVRTRISCTNLTDTNQIQLWERYFIESVPNLASVQVQHGGEEPFSNLHLHISRAEIGVPGFYPGIMLIATVICTETGDHTFLSIKNVGNESVYIEVVLPSRSTRFVDPIDLGPLEESETYTLHGNDSAGNIAVLAIKLSSGNVFYAPISGKGSTSRLLDLEHGIILVKIND